MRYSKKLIEKLFDIRLEAEREVYSKDYKEKAIKLEIYLRGKLEQYSEILSIPAEVILERWENDRTGSLFNYYQEFNQPDLTKKDAYIFETTHDMNHAVGDDGFTCPRCRGISTSPTQCDTHNKLNGTTEVCDWNSYGLFGTLGKGVYVFNKETLTGDHIFKPVKFKKSKALSVSL